MRGISYSIWQTGHCVAKESLVIRGGRSVRVEVPALIALLRHPDRGPILFDAGYSTTMRPHACAHWSSRLYMRLLPVVISPEEDAARQLEGEGLDPGQLETMILSHFHPDHIGGVRDFPNTRFLCLRQAWEPIRHRRGWSASRRGFIPQLLPEDFVDRLTLLDAGREVLDGFEDFGPVVDILGDGSIWGVHLPGHAAGQMGLLFDDSGGRRTLLCADACWYRRSLREKRLPARATYPLLESKVEFERTFEALCRLSRNRPEVSIIPAHCPECVTAEG